MHGRLLAVALAVVLAGCSGTLPPEATDDVETVTAVPVPEDAGPETGVPGSGEGQVNASLLGDAHAESIAGAHTRVLHFHITGGTGLYVDFRETRSVDASNGSLRTRVYEGPGTARFVPDAEGVTSARSERYASGGWVSRRRTVEGRTAHVLPSGPAAPESPIPELDDDELVAAIFENATVVGETPGGDARLVGNDVHPALVPDYLEIPRRVNVRATARSDGHVPHVTVRYLATFQGENVSVTLDVYWLSRSDPVVRPDWAHGEADEER
jgi:hypothetical protein